MLALQYKIDVLPALKEAGFSTYRLQKEKLLSSSTIQKLKKGVVVDNHNMATLCRLLNCQPGDVLEYAPDVEELPH